MTEAELAEENSKGDLRRRPDWLKFPARDGFHYRELKGLMRGVGLHTVCEEARCPNIGECWEQRTATFLILGSTCTRACNFCGVSHGRPSGVDLDEPRRVGSAAQRLRLRYVVVTSVTRDDLPDGGASVYAATIKELKALIQGCRVEVLIPDFGGNDAALRTVLSASPDVLNHNVETVPRVYREVRPGARYERSLRILSSAHQFDPERPVKSGIMVGLGESVEEVLRTMFDIRSAGCDILTVGQYLRPSLKHHPVVRYYEPDEFAVFREEGGRMGFRHVEAGPLVRSSYHARQQVAATE